MDVFLKFIIETDDIEGDCLILAQCTYHKQLATDITKVKGGGIWKKSDQSTMILSGTSFDFGTAKIEDISDCVKRKKVFHDVALYRNISEKFIFKYKTESGEIFDLIDYTND